MIIRREVEVQQADTDFGYEGDIYKDIRGPLHWHDC